MTFRPGPLPAGSWVGYMQLTSTTPAGAVLKITDTYGPGSDHSLAEFITGTAQAAIGDVVINWSRPSARDHCDPTTMTMTVVSDQPTVAALQFGAKVQLTGAVHSQDDSFGGRLNLFIGWIESSQVKRVRVRHPVYGAPLETWQHTITCTDIIGRAAATKIGALPWPEEIVSTDPAFGMDRLRHIEAASPFPLLDPIYGTASGGLCAARDVDNLGLLDALAAAAMVAFRFIHPGANGIRLETFYQQAMADLWGMERGRRQVIPYVPASKITDAERTLDRQAVVNALSVAYSTGPLGNPAVREDTSVTFRDVRPGQSTAEVGVSGDLVVETGTFNETLNGYSSWADSLFQLTRDPIAVLDPVRMLDLGATLDPTWTFVYEQWQRTATLIDMETRSNLAIHITGNTAGVYPWQHVIAGELRLSGDPFAQRLVLTLNPTLLAGQRPLQIGDFVRRPWVGGAQEPTIGFMADTRIQDTELSTLPWDGVPA